MRDWCDGIGAAASGNMGLPEAWCLQYNQHLGKTLLAPVEEPRSIVDEMVKEALARKLPEYIREATQPPKHTPKGQGGLSPCLFAPVFKCRKIFRWERIGRKLRCEVFLGLLI